MKRQFTYFIIFGISLFYTSNIFSQATADNGFPVNTIKTMSGDTAILTTTAPGALISFDHPADGIRVNLEAGNKVKIVNTFGDLTINPGLNPNLTNGGTALIVENPNGSITLNASTTMSDELNFDLMSSGDFIKQGGVVITNGGDFSVEAANIMVMDGGVQSGGGNVFLMASNNATIINGGINSNGGSITSFGIDFIHDNAAILNSNGGDITINHSGIVSFDFSGANSNGGMFTANGLSFNSNSATFNTNSGDVLLDFEEGVSFTGGGTFITNGGSFTSRGTTFEYSRFASLATNGGNILLEHTGDVTIGGNGGGFDTAGGSVTVQACRGAISVLSPVSSSGGNINMLATFGSIQLDAILDTSGGGSPGALTVNEGGEGSIIINVNPNTDGANVTLDTTAQASEFCAIFLEIPTLGQWGLMTLGLLLLIIGSLALKAIPKTLLNN